MGRDLILKSDDGKRYSYPTIRVQAWGEGKADGVEMAAEWVLKRSTEAFGRGEDELARRLRNMSKDLKEGLMADLRKAAQDHKAAYPEIQEDE